MVKDFKTIDSKKYIIEIEGIVSGDKYKFRLRVFLQDKEITSYPIDFPNTFIEDQTPYRKDLDYLELIVLRLVKDHLEDILNPPTYQKAFEYRFQSWFKEANRQTKKQPRVGLIKNYGKRKIVSLLQRKCLPFGQNLPFGLL